jgi:hypothetical protein
MPSTTSVRRRRRRGAAITGAIVASLALAACGDGVTTHDPMHVPQTPVGGTICQGFSHGVFARLCCGKRDVASDGFCHFQLTTSNTNILQILDATHNVQVNTCTPRMDLATIGVSAGQVALFVTNTVSGRTELIGSATVGSQSCL